MEGEELLSGEESLKLISKTIHEAQGYFHETGMGALVYGFSVLICSLLAYAKETGLVNFPFHPFYILIPVIILQSWLQAREEKKKKAKTFTDEAIDHVWFGFLAASLAAWCANIVGLEYLAVMIILFLTGFATFLTGMIAKFRYAIISGCVCWALAVLSFFVLNPAVYLLLGAAVVMALIIPGFILRAYFKKQQHAAG